LTLPKINARLAKRLVKAHALRKMPDAPQQHASDDRRANRAANAKEHSSEEYAAWRIYRFERRDGALQATGERVV
jgi:hypothetical protein